MQKEGEVGDGGFSCHLVGVAVIAVAAAVVDDNKKQFKILTCYKMNRSLNNSVRKRCAKLSNWTFLKCKIL